MAAPAKPILRSYLKRKSTRWSPHFVTVATSSLNRWCRWLDDRGVDLFDATADECSEYLAERSGVVAGSTVHKDYQHLVWFYEWAVAEGEYDAPRGRDRGPMHNVDVPQVNDPDPDHVRPLDDDTYNALMATYDPRNLVDCRNASIMSLMYRTGLRRSEVCRCDIDRVDLTADSPTIEVLGKGNPARWRRVPIAHETAVWIERYLRRLGADRADDGPLFVSTFNGSRTTSVRLKPDAITRHLLRRSKTIGVHISAHQFRRAFAISSRRRGLNDTTIMAVAGWSDARMLDRYQRAERETLAAAEFHAADPTAEQTGRVYRRRRLRAV